MLPKSNVKRLTQRLGGVERQEQDLEKKQRRAKTHHKKTSTPGRDKMCGAVISTQSVCVGVRTYEHILIYARRLDQGRPPSWLPMSTSPPDHWPLL